MNNHWLNRKIKIETIECLGGDPSCGEIIRFTLSNGHIWEFCLIVRGVLEYHLVYPLKMDSDLAIHEYQICREKAWEISNGQG